MRVSSTICLIYEYLNNQWGKGEVGRGGAWGGGGETNIKRTMENTSATRQQAVHTTYKLSPPSCSTTAMQKTANVGEFSGDQKQNKKERKIFFWRMVSK